MRLLCLLLLLSSTSCRTVNTAENRVSAGATESKPTNASSHGATPKNTEQELRERLHAWGLTTPCPVEKNCLTLLQVNNVYEIATVSGSNLGGMDRVATLRRLLAEVQQAGPVLFAHAGDFFGPSGMNTLKDNGKAWAGRQNVATLKAAGLNIAILGGRDLDLPTSDLQERLDEASTPSFSISDSCELLASGANAKPQSLPQTSTDPTRIDPLDASTVAKNYPAMRPKAASPTEILCQGADCPTSRATALRDAYNACALHLDTSSPQSQNCVQWIASNLLQRPQPPTPRPANFEQPLKAAGMTVPRGLILEVGRAPASIRIGLIGLTLTDNRQSQFAIYDASMTAQQLVNMMRHKQGELPSVDALVALTQLESADNLALLEEVPGIDLILAGHPPSEPKPDSPDQDLQCLGEAPRRCASHADSNARTAYVHRLIFDPAAKDRRDRLNIQSKLISIDASIPSDPKIANLIACYYRQADTLLAKGALLPKDQSLLSPIARLDHQTLDGKTASIQRLGGSNLIDFIGNAMLKTSESPSDGGRQVKLALIHSGLIKLADQLGPGTLQYYDALRVLPIDSRIIPMRINLRDLATILHQNWTDLPLNSDALLHTYPRLAVVSRIQQEISRKSIEDSLLEIIGGTSLNNTVSVVVPEAWLNLAKTSTPDALEAFTPLDSTAQPSQLRASFIEALRRQFPL